MLFVRNMAQISLRLFEMFLGPLEQAKPWKTSGISGVSFFLKKLMEIISLEKRTLLFVKTPTKDELKHCIKPLKK